MRPPQDELDHDAAELPDIDLVRISLLLPLLWSEILFCPTNLILHRWWGELSIPGAREAKVSEYASAVFVYEDVVGFDVSVQDSQ